MPGKETTNISNLLAIIQLFRELEISFWIDGGWGVDILAGKQTRSHRDIDINFDAAATEQVLEKLAECGYEVETDCLPTRMELYSEARGYLDIHPFELLPDGRARQADPEGGWWTFDRDFFTHKPFHGTLLPCMSLKAQLAFHTGYELRSTDLHDLDILQTLMRSVANAPAMNQKMLSEGA